MLMLIKGGLDWCHAEALAGPTQWTRCWDCVEWEPILNENRGWCPVFSKETAASHGSQCTAFRRMPKP